MPETPYNNLSTTGTTGIQIGGIKKKRSDGAWRPTLQETTFAISMLFQLTTLVLGIVALGKEAVPEVLRLVLVLEVVVQVVEFVWYTLVGLNYAFRQGSISIAYRYLDWAITTPVMLVSIFLFVRWDSNQECTSIDKIFNDGSHVAAIVSIVLADYLMLAIGAAYEIRFESATRALDRVAMCFSGLYLGFIPFLGAFAPLIVTVSANFSTWGFLSVALTFVTWAFYGAVAILGENSTLSEESRNSAYNLLDIVSKNVVGLVVSSVALGNEFVLSSNSTDCAI